MISRAQFLHLAGQLYDALDGGSSAQGASAPVGDGRAPKFDTSIIRKGGMVQYASETDLAGLIFWKGRADEPPSDPKYAESNAKQSKALSYWISYRQAEPNAVWSGERNRQPVTARPPSAKPETYPRGEPQTSAPMSSSTESFDETDDIPF
jgi:hypothetical protein